MGNVALDVTRILSKTREEFAGSDIVAHALDVLDTSKLRRIVILGRRGPHQIMMTPKELGELSHLSRAAPRVDPQDLPEVGEDALLEPGLRKSVNHLRSFAAIPASHYGDVPIEIEFDSQYAAYSVTQWGPSWRAKGLTGKANMELIYEIIDIVEARPSRARIKWTHVRGHTGHPLNETADALASKMTKLNAEHRESGVTAMEQPKVRAPRKKGPSKRRREEHGVAEPVPGACSHEGCNSTYADHHWGHKAAQRDGWFFQKNGHSWCPQHVPSWVGEWRASKSRGEGAQS